MKRRWFLIGLSLPVISVGCQAITHLASTRLTSSQQSGPGSEQTSGETADVDGTAINVVRNSKTLVMATAANYPPYEQAEGEGEDKVIVGFDIDLAELIAERLQRKLSIVDLELGSLIPAVAGNEVDMAMAALEPSRRRKQKVDFSNIYYRARHALISLDGYLRSRDLNYQTIGLRAGSVQARFADKLSAEHPDLEVIAFETLDEVFEALDVGAVEGAILETTVATAYLRRYPDFEAKIINSEGPTGSAIALPKDSPLRRDINAALTDIKASGEMNRLITKWFS